MNRQKVITALKSPIGGREVMTLTEFCKAWGCKDMAYAKRKYGLNDLDTIVGRYFVEDLADAIVRRGQ